MQLYIKNLLYWKYMLRSTHTIRMFVTRPVLDVFGIMKGFTASDFVTKCCTFHDIAAVALKCL